MTVDALFVRPTRTPRQACGPVHTIIILLSETAVPVLYYKYEPGIILPHVRFLLSRKAVVSTIDYAVLLCSHVRINRLLIFRTELLIFSGNFL